MSDFKGGRISLTVNGQVFTSRASAKIMPSLVSTKNGANQNGTMFSTVEAKLATLDATFDRGKPSLIKWDAAMLLAAIDATFIEDDAGITHLFTSARWSGDPTIDTATGEVSGMKIETDQYMSQ